MITSAEITLNEDYYRSYYSDWLTSRIRRRKHAPLVGALIIGFGLFLILHGGKFQPAGAGIIGIGVFHPIEALTHRTRWIKQRLQSGASSFARDLLYERKCPPST